MPHLALNLTCELAKRPLRSLMKNASIRQRVISPKRTHIPYEQIRDFQCCEVPSTSMHITQNHIPRTLCPVEWLHTGVSVQLGNERGRRTYSTEPEILWELGNSHRLMDVGICVAKAVAFKTTL